MYKIQKHNLFISTIDSNAAALASEYGIGLEIAEYCTAYNMDLYFEETDAAVRQKLQGISHRILHAPFNELFPCAIDPKARELAAERYRQALALAQAYGAEKIVIHSGYAPTFYYDCWFEEQSVLFWKQFLETLPDTALICLENVLEPQPEPLLHILEAVDDPRLRICLDVGHAHTYSERPVEEWLELFSPFISHFHVHNNDRSYDAHNHLYDGTIAMKQLLIRALQLCPDASFTLEIPDAAADLAWLKQENHLDV